MKFKSSTKRIKTGQRDGQNKVTYLKYNLVFLRKCGYNYLKSRSKPGITRQCRVHNEKHCLRTTQSGTDLTELGKASSVLKVRTRGIHG